eukprot:7206481-Pyramimonas_sp.AAC.1
MRPPSVPPIQYEVGETTLERQTRIRPSATPPVISDGDFNKCAICLDHFMHRDRSGGVSVVLYSMHSDGTELHALMWTDSWLALWK